MVHGDRHCKGCNNIKPLDNFELRKDSGIYRWKCKDCRRTINTNNKREQYSKNPKRFREARREYWKGNLKMLEWNRKYQRKWRENNIESARKKARDRFAKRYGKDLEFTIRHKLRSRFGVALGRNYKSGSVIDNLGCTIAELICYLEQLFLEGMSWENYGKWHIDHIRPLADFNLQDEGQLVLACHYTNLQPLWAKDNLSKGAR